MAHNGKWRRSCGIKKSQECYNCANKQKITESKNKVTVVCDIGCGQRTLDFSRCVTAYCGAWCESKQIKE
jgi:hypothetical protein